MSRDLLIGIGGTGAKCVEHVVHLLAAGGGPDDLNIGLVDQDRANGNVDWTRSLITRYAGLREALREIGDAGIDPASRYFHTHIGTQEFWCPLPESNMTLREIFHYDMLQPGLRGLMDGLFHNTEEQKLDLNEGFRGRPAIGAATIVSRAGGGAPLWKLVDEAAQQARAGDDVRIMLVGSIFGGTGAAGLPSMSRLIRQNLEMSGITSGVHIGGILMLPYFRFPTAEGESEIVASSEEFMERSQGSLLYYAQYLEDQKLFDSLYLVGWDPLISIDNHHRGGPQQYNPPLLPELYGALAACDFFARTSEVRTGVSLIGRREGTEMSWPDLPDANGYTSLVAQLGTLIRFAYAFHYVYGPALLDNRRQVSKEPWYKRLVLAGRVDGRSELARTMWRDMSDYCGDVLNWAATMSSVSSSPDCDVRLFNTQLFATGTGSASRLRESQPSGANKGFARLLYDRKDADLADVFNRLTYARPAPGHTGLGLLPGHLFDSCDIDDGR